MHILREKFNNQSFDHRLSIRLGYLLLCHLFVKRRYLNRLGEVCQVLLVAIKRLLNISGFLSTLKSKVHCFYSLRCQINLSTRYATRYQNMGSCSNFLSVTPPNQSGSLTELHSTSCVVDNTGQCEEFIMIPIRLPGLPHVRLSLLISHYYDSLFMYYNLAEEHFVSCQHKNF